MLEVILYWILFSLLKLDWDKILAWAWKFNQEIVNITVQIHINKVQINHFVSWVKKYIQSLIEYIINLIFSNSFFLDISSLSRLKIKSKNTINHIVQNKYENENQLISNI